ncbi:TPA: hypothetical protein N0F65_007190 [Lagenidium giganteum]|uniref:Uncharacterized protein n=1 Tax=Lagenidium giganteum TaxID=4803 RepID=A0AAV2Z7T8_9STRA|nr:TPA: hypothetical protein N0F65_007190 [Lagenidium giganteum]
MTRAHCLSLRLRWLTCGVDVPRISHALGFHATNAAPVEFLNESLVVFPVGHHLAFLHLENQAMDFLEPTHTVQAIQSFHVSADREYLAVAEVHCSSVVDSLVAMVTTPLKTQMQQPMITGGTASPFGSHSHVEQKQQHVLSIYKVSTRHRTRTLALSHSATIVSCSFSADNKFLVMLEDAPSHNVTYWKVSTGKLLASSKCPSRGSRIHISPNNSSYISVSGPTILKYWVWTQNDFKIGNLLPPTREQEHFVDHIWLREYMAAVSERGMLLCFRSTPDYAGVDLVHTYKCHQPSFVRLECIATHTKGFVIGGSAGFFSMYECSDDPKDPFLFVRTIAVGDIAFECIAVSPSMETIVAYSKSQEMITFSMGAIDVVQEDRVGYREIVKFGDQIGAVLQVDSCIQRPTIVTCGTDRTVRMWNYELRLYELQHQFPEEPNALSVHPSGFMLIVAFKERVRIYNILQESLRQIRELSIKSCRVVKFAHGGHVFACASGITVSTFRTYTCEPVHSFSGHIAAVRCLNWSRDDYYLFSAAHDGAIYRWNNASGTRCEEMQHVVKQCQYAALAVDQRDYRVVVAAGSDGRLRQIVSGEEVKSLELPAGVYITALAIMRDNSRLFAGTSLGSILVFPWPLADYTSGAWEIYGQTDAIACLRVTEDNQQLFSAAEDGTVCVYKILAVDAAYQRAGLTPAAEVDEYAEAIEHFRLMPTKKASPHSFTDAVLVSREDLEERQNALVEMQQKYDQVKADVEFALHRKENEWIDRLRVTKEESESLVIQERVRYEELEARHQQALRKHAEDMAIKEANHVVMTQELENQYERKLAQEIARYDALSETLEQTRQRCEALIESQDNQHRGLLHSERKAAHARTKEQNSIIKRLHDDVKYNQVKFEEILHQQETEYEQELQKQRSDFEKQLEVERANTAMKQGQLSATTTKLESLKKKLQELKASSHARDIILSTEKARSAKLELALVQYERHFEHCKDVMSDKEKEIGGLKSTNRILENFRSVLDHRIDNLEMEKAPMEAHVEALENQMGEMKEELVEEFKTKAAIQQDMIVKDAKIKMLLHEVKKLRQNMLKREYAMSEMTRELSRMVQMTNVKDLEAAVKDAYKVYVIGETIRKKPPKLLSGSSSLDKDHVATPSPSKLTPGGKQTQQPQVPASPQKRASIASSNVPASPAKGQKGKPEPAKPANAAEVAAQAMASVAASDEMLGYDCKHAVDESVKQVEFMSRTIVTLRAALESTKMKADRIRRDSVAEGSILIEECNKLRKENKAHIIHIRELEHMVSAGRYAQAMSPSAGASTMPSTPLKGNRTLGASASSPALPTQATDGPEKTDGDDMPQLVINSPSSKLMPLHRSKSSHTAGRARTPVSPSAARVRHGSPVPTGDFRRGNANHMLRMDDMQTTVEQQKREIKRLQRQVSLLLADDRPGIASTAMTVCGSGLNDEKLTRKIHGVHTGPTTTSEPNITSAHLTTRQIKEMTPEKNHFHHDAIIPIPMPVMTARPGNLRPITPHAAPQLHSSFVLSASDPPKSPDR